MLEKKDLRSLDTDILLLGETGTGKSKLARQLHECSSRSGELFTQININALNSNTFESELFGHKKGSFTGALSDRAGFLESVGAGTLFLDEIGDLSLELQAKLLLVIEDKIFYPVGSTLPKKFKGRLIFATHQDIEELTDQKKFRKDLYYRLSYFTYTLPPLRLHPQKKLEILECFHRMKKETRNHKVLLTEEAVNNLCQRSWKGNYRELNNYLRLICIKHKGLVELSALLGVRSKKEPSRDDFHAAVQLYEKEFIEIQLQKNNGMVNYTAKKIGISKVTLISKIKKYGINREQLKHTEYSYG